MGDPTYISNTADFSLLASKPVSTSDHDHHHHAGLWDKIKRFYARFLQSFYLKIFYLEQAGRVARYARITRILSNFIIIAGVILGLDLMGKKDFFTDGIFPSYFTTLLIGLNAVGFGLLAMIMMSKKLRTNPMHLAVGLIVSLLMFGMSSTLLLPALSLEHLPSIIIIWGMVTNTFALGVGAAANNEKISPRYAVQAELHDRIERTKKRVNEAPAHHLLHGIFDYRRYHKGLFKMTLVRGLHDVNGGIGTFFSFLLSLAAMSVFNLNFIATMSIFIITRISGGISAGGALYTHNYRFARYLEIILIQQSKHISLTEQENITAATKARECVDAIFNEKNLDPNHYYTKLLSYRFYIAIYDSLRIKKLDNTAIDETLKNRLNTLLDSYLENGALSREKLMNIARPENSTQAAILSNLPMIENEIFIAFNPIDNIETLNAIAQEATQNLTETFDGNSDHALNKELLHSYLLRSLVTYRINHPNQKLNEEKIVNAITENFKDTKPDDIANALGGETGPHGDNFMGSLHIPNMTEEHSHGPEIPCNSCTHKKFTSFYTAIAKSSCGGKDNSCTVCYTPTP